MKVGGAVGIDVMWSVLGVVGSMWVSWVNAVTLALWSAWQGWGGQQCCAVSNQSYWLQF